MKCEFCEEQHPNGVSVKAAAGGHPILIDFGGRRMFVRREGSPSPWADGKTYPTLPELWAGLRSGATR